MREVVPVVGKLRLLRCGVAHGQALARAVSDPGWLGSAAREKVNCQSLVVSGTAPVDGREQGVVVKTLALNRPKDVLSRLAHVTRGLRQWRGASLLAARGIETARPLALFRGRGEREVVESIVVELVEGASLLDVMVCGQLSWSHERELCERAGKLVRRMLDRNIFNRDNKPSNVMVRRGDEGDWELVLIDTVGVRAIAPWERRCALAARMLASLYIEPRRIMIPRRAVCWRVLVHATPGAGRGERRRLWRETERRIINHRRPRSDEASSARRRPS